nr:RNA-directed DNA polymerase, eukaryota, reverse transcriptase zinc-binding domain protein [Tanacetum cinerariifolium]
MSTPDSMKDCNIFDRLFKLGKHLSLAWNWRRPIRNDRENEEIECLACLLEGVELKSGPYGPVSLSLRSSPLANIFPTLVLQHSCAMGEAAPKPKASARKKKGDSASSTTTPTLTPTTTAESAPRLSASAKGKRPLRATTTAEPTDLQRTEAEQLKLVLKRSRHETHISQQSGFGIGEVTGSKPGVPDVPSDDSEEELSWKSSKDEEVGGQEEGNESNDDSDDGSDKDSEETVKSGAGKDGDDDDDEDDDDDAEEEETAKDDTKTGTGGEEVRERAGESEEEKETSEDEEVSFDPIPRTPEDSEKESDDGEDQESRLREEARIQEEEDAEELYRTVNINQGRGLQVTQSIEDTHVILTSVDPDDPQESSSMSSFVSSMLNPLSDEGVESIFTTTSSQSVSLVPPTPIMNPSTTATITTSHAAQIPPPTIPSIILENLPTFNSAFRFEERLRLLETSFNEYRRTNQVAGATDQLQDSLQRENDEFLRNIDENIKNVLKGLVKTQHEVHANKNKMILDRFTQHTVDSLALMSTVSNQQHYPQSSTTLSSIYVQPHFVDTTQLDSRLSTTDNLIENLTNTLALLTQSYKTYLPQTNNQLRTSSNPRNKPQFKTAWLSFRMFRVDRIEDMGTMHGVQAQLVMGALRTELAQATIKLRIIQRQDVADASQENEVALDEEKLLFIIGGQDNAVDEDVDEQPVQDLALNVDNVFQADDCDAFDSDVDEAPTTHTLFMANLSSAYPVYDKAGCKIHVKYRSFHRIRAKPVRYQMGQVKAQGNVGLTFSPHGQPPLGQRDAGTSSTSDPLVPGVLRSSL